MASQKERERQARVDAIAEEIGAYVDNGMSYERATARYYRNHPEVTQRSRTLVKDAVDQTKARRAAAGRAQARATRERNWWNRAVDAAMAGNVQEDFAGEVPTVYQPWRWMGIRPSRVRITYEDPQTGAGRTRVVYLPLLPHTSQEWLASAVAAALAQADHVGGYDRRGGERDMLYQAVWQAMRAGQMSIQNPQ